MVLRDGMASMSLDGSLAATPLPGVNPTAVEYLHLLPNLLVSAHPDYVMTHRMVPLAPDRTWVECSWLTLPDSGARGRGARRRGVLGHHQPAGLGRLRVGAARARSRRTSGPGRSRPREDAVAQLVSMIGAAYRSGGLSV